MGILLAIGYWGDLKRESVLQSQGSRSRSLGPAVGGRPWEGRPRSCEWKCALRRPGCRRGPAELGPRQPQKHGGLRCRKMRLTPPIPHRTELRRLLEGSTRVPCLAQAPPSGGQDFLMACQSL